MSAGFCQPKDDWISAEKKYTYTQLGMLFGIIIGGGIGVLLFVFTNNALYIAGAGVGLVIGLILGEGYERQQKSKADES